MRVVLLDLPLVEAGTQLRTEQATAVVQVRENPPQFAAAIVTNQSPQEIKIALFRRLFRRREDVYPRRFESFKTGKTGYQPACRNE